VVDEDEDEDEEGEDEYMTIGVRRAATIRFKPAYNEERKLVGFLLVCTTSCMLDDRQGSARRSQHMECLITLV